MSKITLNNVNALTNETSALGTINANSATVQSAMDNTLSRDGTSPNTMLADFDMNSNHILNLPSPVSDTEPLRLTDLEAFLNGNLTVNINSNFASEAEAAAGVNTTKVMNPLRTKQSIQEGTFFTQSGTGAVARTINSKIGEWVSVTDFGAVAGTSVDQSDNVQKAIDYCKNVLNGGTVFFPAGFWRVDKGITITGPQQITLQGAAGGNSAIGVGDAATMANIAPNFINTNNTTTITITNSKATLRDLTIFGPGIQSYIIWTTSPALVGGNACAVYVNGGSVEVLIDHCAIAGGWDVVRVDGADCSIVDSNLSGSVGTGGASCRSRGSAPWLSRVKMDQNWPIQIPTTFKNRTNGLICAVGDVLLRSDGYYVQVASITGDFKTGGSEPALKPGLTLITDGNVTYYYACGQNQVSFCFDSNASEAHLDRCDLSGAYWHALQYGNSLSATAPSMLIATDCVFSQSVSDAISLLIGDSIMLHGNEIVGGINTGAGGVSVSGSFGGNVVCTGNIMTGLNNGGTGVYIGGGASSNVSDNIMAGYTNGVVVEANVSNFNVVDNIFGGPFGTIAGTGVVVTAGTSDHYIIDGNIFRSTGTAIVDAGTGTDKRVQSGNHRQVNFSKTAVGGTCNTTIGDPNGLGYATGAGGTVTQATSKSTGVTLNKPTGTITMNNANLAAGTSVAFTLTNSCIAATDTVIVNLKSGGTANSYFVSVDSVSAGSCSISLRNYTGGALAEAVVLSFNIIKGVAA